MQLFSIHNNIISEDNDSLYPEQEFAGDEVQPTRYSTSVMEPKWSARLHAKWLFLCHQPRLAVLPVVVFALCCGLTVWGAHESVKKGLTAPAIVMVVVLSLSNATLLFALLMAWARQELLLSALRPPSLRRVRSGPATSSRMRMRSMSAIMQRQRAQHTQHPHLSTVADRVMCLVADTLAGKVPNPGDALAVHTALLERTDIYTPQDLETQMAASDLDPEVASNLTRMLGSSRHDSLRVSSDKTTNHTGTYTIVAEQSVLLGTTSLGHISASRSAQDHTAASLHSTPGGASPLHSSCGAASTALQHATHHAPSQQRPSSLPLLEQAAPSAVEVVAAHQGTAPGGAAGVVGAHLGAGPHQQIRGFADMEEGVRAIITGIGLKDLGPLIPTPLTQYPVPSSILPCPTEASANQISKGGSAAFLMAHAPSFNHMTWSPSASSVSLSISLARSSTAGMSSSVVAVPTHLLGGGGGLVVGGTSSYIAAAQTPLTAGTFSSAESGLLFGDQGSFARGSYLLAGRNTFGDTPEMAPLAAPSASMLHPCQSLRTDYGLDKFAARVRAQRVPMHYGSSVLSSGKDTTQATDPENSAILAHLHKSDMDRSAGHIMPNSITLDPNPQASPAGPHIALLKGALSQERRLSNLGCVNSASFQDGTDREQKGSISSSRPHSEAGNDVGVQEPHSAPAADSTDADMATITLRLPSVSDPANAMPECGMQHTDFSLVTVEPDTLCVWPLNHSAGNGAAQARAAGTGACVIDAPKPAPPLSPPSPDTHVSHPPTAPIFTRTMYEEVEVLLQRASTSWVFNSFDLAQATQGHPLSSLAFFLLNTTGLVSLFKLDGVKLARFLRAAEASYRDNAYHNATHAADVLQTFHILTTRGGLLQRYLTPIHHLAAYLAATVHDLEHVGLNNDFLTTSRDTLAIIYNDRSPMENHHLAAAFGLMRRPACAFLEGLDPQEYGVLRRTMIELVLGTDMKQHVCLTTQFASLHRIDASAAVTAAAAALEPLTGPRLANLHPVHRQAHRHTRGPGNNVLRAWTSRLRSLRRIKDFAGIEVPAISSMTGGVKGLMLRALVSLDYRGTSDMDGRVPAVTRPATIDIMPEAEVRPQPGSKPQPNGHVPSSKDSYSPPDQLSTGLSQDPYSLGAAPERGQLSPKAPLGGTVWSQLGVQGQRRVPRKSGSCTTLEGTTSTQNMLASAKTSPTSQLHIGIASENISGKVGHGRAKAMCLPTLVDAHANRGTSKGGNCPPVSAADMVPLISGVGVAAKGAHRLPMVELHVDAKSDELGLPKAKPGAARNAPPTPAPQPAEQTEEATRLLVMQIAFKCADLGHLAESRDVHTRWVACLQEESFLQGDREKALGLTVSPLYDRNKAGVTRSQVGFFDFCVLPLFFAYTRVFPAAKPLWDAVVDNYGYWKVTEAQGKEKHPELAQGNEAGKEKEREGADSKKNGNNGEKVQAEVREETGCKNGSVQEDKQATAGVMGVNIVVEGDPHTPTPPGGTVTIPTPNVSAAATLTSVRGGH